MKITIECTAEESGHIVAAVTRGVDLSELRRSVDSLREHCINPLISGYNNLSDTLKRMAPPQVEVKQRVAHKRRQAPRRK